VFKSPTPKSESNRTSTRNNQSEPNFRLRFHQNLKDINSGYHQSPEIWNRSKPVVTSQSWNRSHYFVGLCHIEWRRFNIYFPTLFLPHHHLPPHQLLFSSLIHPLYLSRCDVSNLWGRPAMPIWWTMTSSHHVTILLQPHGKCSMPILLPNSLLTVMQAARCVTIKAWKFGTDQNQLWPVRVGTDHIIL